MTLPLEFSTQAKRDPELLNFTCTAVVNCVCGKGAIVVYFIPGLPLKCFCKHCKRTYAIARINWDISTMPMPAVGIGTIEPDIIVPEIDPSKLTM